MLRFARFCLAAAVLAVALCAAPLPVAAAPGQKAQTFYESLLAAQDAATLQAYLDCFSTPRMAEWWAALTPDQQAQAAARLQKLLGALPAFAGGTAAPDTSETSGTSATSAPPTAAPTATPQPAAVGQPVVQATAAYDEKTRTYTLTLEAWQQGAVLYAAVGQALRFGPEAQVRAWAVDKTAADWASAKLEQPEVALQTDAEAGSVLVTGFDYAAHAVTAAPTLGADGRAAWGRKLVVRITGLQPAYPATCGGQGIPALAAASGLYANAAALAAGDPLAAAPNPRVDIPFLYLAQPASQTLLLSRPPDWPQLLAGAGTPPDGQNNAWVEITYTLRQNNQPVAQYCLPAGAPLAAGAWLSTPPAPDTRQDTRYTVTAQLQAVQPASGVGPVGCDAARYAAPAFLYLLQPGAATLETAASAA